MAHKKGWKITLVQSPQPLPNSQNIQDKSLPLMMTELFSLNLFSKSKKVW